MLCTLIGAIILSINIQGGLNMHRYEDIGNASSWHLVLFSNLHMKDLYYYDLAICLFFATSFA